MLPLLVMVVIGLVVGIARGGSPAALGRVQLRAVPLVFVGLVIQLAAIFVSTRGIAVAMTLAASVAVLAFATANVRRPGMLLIVLGALMNLTVVGVNNGMPISRHALARAQLEDLFVSGRPPSVHFLADSSTRLSWLGDVLPMPPPVRHVYSPGDAVLWTGLLLTVQGLMIAPGRRRRGATRRDDFPALPEPDKSH